MSVINVISMSNASDLGYLALADVASAGIDANTYRIDGGHMVQLLIHVYPTPEAIERSTADADAGIDRAIAAGQYLHEHLLAQGYKATVGNSYQRTNEEGGKMAVDLLIPHGTVGKSEVLNERGFDAIPGLGFALSAPPILVDAKVHLKNGDDLQFAIPAPDIEAALILKALAWLSRKSAKDLTDISSLMEITHRHKGGLADWGIGDERRASRGSRRDACTALHVLKGELDKGIIAKGAAIRTPARLSALIGQHVPGLKKG